MERKDYITKRSKFKWMFLDDNGKIRYEIKKRKFKNKIKCAIFDANGKRVSNWFVFIAHYGLLKGESEYYIAYKYKHKSEDILLKAVFHKSGFQVTDWCTYIAPDGLVTGLSDYVYCRSSDIMKIYNKDGELIWKLKKKIARIIPCSRNGKFILVSIKEKELTFIDLKRKNEIKIKDIETLKLRQYINLKEIYVSEFVNETLKCPECNDEYYVYFVADNEAICPFCCANKLSVFML